MVTLAQKLRKLPTPAEIRLWRLLYPIRTAGFHFRKQVQLGRFVADFACLHAQLIVEVDGETHFTDEGLAKDVDRDAYFEGRGFTVLHFTNDEVMGNGDGVLVTISGVLDGRGATQRMVKGLRLSRGTPLPASSARGGPGQWEDQIGNTPP